MKIIIGSESFAPSISGVSIFAERMANHLAKNGHEVYVFVPSQTPKTYIDQNYKNFKVVRFSSIKNPFRRSHRIAYRPSKEIESQIERIGKPDLIHLQDPTSVCSALLKVAKKNHIPVVLTNHFSMDFILSYVKNLSFLHPVIERYLKARFRRFYNQCDLITTPSETAKKKISGWGFKTPLRVMSNGIDTKRFHPVESKDEARKKFNLPDKPIVIYSGRIDKDKSVDVLMRAIPQVLEKIQAHFFFVGSGQMVPELKVMAGGLRVKDSVTFWGWLDYNSPDFPLAYQCSSVFASPSRIETQSIVMLEALATGLPIVAARAGSFPEFIKDGRNGYLFTPGNSKEMAEKIIEVLDDKAGWQKLSHGASETVREHAVDKCLDNFISMYKEIIGNKEKA